jgi:hypothetical protein
MTWNSAIDLPNARRAFRVGKSRLESLRRDPDRLRGDSDAPAVERRHRDLEPLPFPPEPVFDRNHDVGQEDLDRSGGVDAELDLVPRPVEAGRVRVHQERRDAARLLRGVGHREEQAEVRLLPAGDEDLLSGDPIVAPLENGATLLVGGVRAGVRLRQGEASELLAARERCQEAFLSGHRCRSARSDRRRGSC